MIYPAHAVCRRRIHPLQNLSLFLAFLIAVSVSGCQSIAAKINGGGHTQVINIGYQKGSESLVLLKERPELERKLRVEGYTLKWTEFQAGLPLLEAMNAGSVDFGATGGPPAVFAQAAGTPLVYVGASLPNPKSNAILVPRGSSITDVSQLKGKRVAVQQGSSSHALLIEALRRSGLDYGDIKPIYLQPSDARAAFQKGSVDAWAIWDPYFAVAQRTTGARVLTDGTGLSNNRGFYLASRDLAEKHTEALRLIMYYLEQADSYAASHPAKVAPLISKELGVDVPTLLVVEHRKRYGVLPITPAILREQQELADTFSGLKLIPKRLDVKDASLSTSQDRSILGVNNPKKTR